MAMAVTMDKPIEKRITSSDTHGQFHGIDSLCEEMIVNIYCQILNAKKNKHNSIKSSYHLAANKTHFCIDYNEISHIL